jgi:DNA repair protein RadC
LPYYQLIIKAVYKKCGSKNLPTPTISTAADAYDVILRIADHSELLWREELLLICLSPQNKLMCWYSLGKGDLNSVTADIAILATVVACSGSTNIILAHNHPSGSLHPSQRDIECTQHIKTALATIGRTLIDHIIFTAGAFLSMQEAGYIS